MENNEERTCIDRSCNCIAHLVKKIIKLQKSSNGVNCEGGCERPFLGPESIDCFNTRPVSFYSCCTGDVITIDNSIVFRLESIDGCCCTCRVLNFDNGVYTSTNNFFTINLDCVSAIKCFNDINLAL